MSLKKKLNRLKPHLGGSEKRPVEESLVVNKTVSVPHIKLWEQEQTKPYFVDEDYCLVRTVSYPLNYQLGKYAISDLFTAVNAWNQSAVSHPLSAAGHRAQDLFFFDTETTGLGGGVGNTIFLLGHARICAEEITVKQHILPHPGAEVPLYQSFLESVDYKTLVTYNGKAFDWPQVKTRHTLVREHVPKLPQFGHFDLYHAARRMWKHKLDRIKLSVVEKEILGIERKDDIPGFLAPMIYFDFVETKNPQGLLGVIKHNEHDILSLISLYIHLTFQLLGIDREQTAKETFEVGKWYASLGFSHQAKDVFSKLVEDDSRESLIAMHALAFEHKKSKEWNQAILLWEKVAAHGPSLMKKEACIELAKLFEHKLRDFESALKYCHLAKSAHEEVLDNTGEDPFQTDIEKRINRLLHKRKK